MTDPSDFDYEYVDARMANAVASDSPHDAANAPRTRELTMQDRLLVVAHIQTLANQDQSLQVIADSVIESVRCCDYFPECSHVVDESERVEREERAKTWEAWKRSRERELAAYRELKRVEAVRANSERVARKALALAEEVYGWAVHEPNHHRLLGRISELREQLEAGRGA